MSENKIQDILSATISSIIDEKIAPIKDLSDRLSTSFQANMSILRHDIEGNLHNRINDLEQRLVEIIKESPPPTKLEVYHYDKPESFTKHEFNVDNQHKEFTTLLKLMELRCNVYIVGPTGTGKTKTSLVIAKEVLKLPVASITLGPQTPESKIKGYMDAHGKYVPGAAFEVYKNGGILIINELDNGNASMNVVINELSDDECFFPCGTVNKHPQFFLIATANTIGNGANRQYVGRAPQDKALLNRFVFLEWNYDFELERRLGWMAYCKYFVPTESQPTPNEKVFTKILHDFWKIRRASEDLKLDVIYSSRNFIDQQVRMVASGVNNTTIAKTVFCRGMELDQYRKLIAAAKMLRASDVCGNKDEVDITDETLMLAAPTGAPVRTGPPSAYRKAARGKE